MSGHGQIKREAVNLKAIVGATVIDGTGAAPRDDATILIDGDRIRWIGRSHDAKIPEHTELIDARNRYVIPGLMDANVHLCGPYPDVLLEYEGRYTELIEEGAQLTLQAGITTVFDTWGPLEPLLAARDRINRGDVVGSRMFVAGTIIGFDGPLSDDFHSPGHFLGPDTIGRINSWFDHGVGRELLWMTPEGVRQRVREYLEHSDIDFLKYASSGHGKFREFIAFSQSVQRAIVEEAHRAGLTAQAHSTTVESLRMAIAAGADLLQLPTSPRPSRFRTIY